MNKEKWFNAPTTLQKQIILGFAILAIMSSLSFLIIFYIQDPTVMREESKAIHDVEIETIGSKIDSETAWRYAQDSKTEEIKKELSVIQSEIVKARDENKFKSDDKSTGIEELQREVIELRGLINELASVQNVEKVDESNVRLQGVDNGIRRIKMQLSEYTPEKKSKNIEDTIPAGSFAKAVLLGGVDASTALTSQSDPRPILIRIIDPGTLPRKFISDLEDCHIVASGYGDLSSERVFARLEKLTCVERKSGEIIETDVAGYVSGEDGRAGIKGIVVEKGRGYLAKSVLGGVLQGISAVLNSGQSAVINSSGAFFGKSTPHDKLNEGVMSGTGSSMDRLSKYYIERAESIQPVIQIQSGRIVDVIFTEGSDIGTENIKEKLNIKRERQSENLENKDVW